MLNNSRVSKPQKAEAAYWVIEHPKWINYGRGDEATEATRRQHLKTILAAESAFLELGPAQAQKILSSAIRMKAMQCMRDGDLKSALTHWQKLADSDLPGHELAEQEISFLEIRMKKGKK